MDYEVANVLNACALEKLPSLPLLNDAIQQLQKLEEDLKKCLNTNANDPNQPQYRNQLQTVQQRLIQVYEKFDKLEAEELDKNSKAKKKDNVIDLEDHYTPEIDPSEIEYTDKDFLGQGSFGRVYAGRCRGKRVAVKVPLKQDLSEKELEDFRHEVIIMNRIRCANSIFFFGASTVKGQLKIVTELMYTDVEKLIRSNRTLSLYQKMKMMKDAALGINWIHGITNIIHRDLKPANLLVDENLNVKITDFGFSQLKEQNFIQSNGVARGTPLYMAPEILMGKQFNEKADIYSFGIILWQVYTRKEPFANHNDLRVFRNAVCKQHERPEIPSDCPPSVTQLIEKCWDADLENRPSMKEIIFAIDEILIESVMTNENARKWWKTHFLIPRQELNESVPWNELVTKLTLDLTPQAHNPNFHRDTFRKLKEILAEKSIDESKFIVTMSKFDIVATWFGNYFTPGPEAWRFLEEIRVLVDKEWFHGEIERDVAEKRLLHRPDGSFLVRLSSTTPECPFTLSLPKGHHRRIKHLPGSDYSFKGSSIKYNSIIDLVENCRDEVAPQLRAPCPKSVINAEYGYK